MSEMRSIAALTCNKKLQMREGINAETVERYAEAIREAKGEWPFPPIQVVATFVVDGWHRLEAAKLCGLKEVPIADHAKDLSSEDNRFEAALILSCGANARHGLPRSNADKRKAVITLLEYFPDKTFRQIAGIAHVSHTFVNQVRRDLCPEEKSGKVSTADHLAIEKGLASVTNQVSEIDSRALGGNVSTASPLTIGTNAAVRATQATGLPNTERGGGNQSAPTDSQADARGTCQPGTIVDVDLSDATARRCPNIEAKQSPSYQSKSKSVLSKTCVPKRPLVDDVTDCMQTLGTLNKQFVALKTFNRTSYDNCRRAMKIIDENLEQLLEDAKAANA